MTTTPTVGQVSSWWGKRKARIPGMTTFHRGVDIAVPVGTDVVAPQAGVVTTSTYNLIRGHYVVVDHGGGWSTSSQHLSERLVKRGDRVAEGQRIGRSGRTGNVTGPHNHTEVRWQGTPVDPAPWYAARGVTLGVATPTAPPAPPTPTPVAPTPAVPLEVLSMDEIITRAFRHHTGFAPSEEQLDLFTVFAMAHGLEETERQIAQSPAGRVAAIFRDEVGHQPPNGETVSAHLAQFTRAGVVDYNALRAGIHAGDEARRHRGEI